MDKTELAKFFSIVPGMEKAYALKEAFRAIYTCGNKMDALRSFEIWESTIPEASDYEPFRKFAGTVHRWEEEIFNFFDYPYTNAFTECFNGRAKQTNREGKGYSFSVLRAKMLYGTSASSYIKVKKRKKVITSSNDPLSNMKDINFGFMSLITPQWGYEEVSERHFGVDVKDLVKQLSDSADG